MFNPSQADVRRFFCSVWQKHKSASILTGLEAIALDWIKEHPQYHADLADAEVAVAADFSVDAGRTNPFLHLSMHLAIAEQISINQPHGIQTASAALTHKLNSAHLAAHQIMECLGEVMWTAQRSNLPPDNEAYIDCIQRRASARL